jgi:hypothetical protein
LSEAPVWDASCGQPDGGFAKAGNFAVVYVDKEWYRDIIDIVDDMAEDIAEDMALKPCHWAAREVEIKIVSAVG